MSTHLFHIEGTTDTPEVTLDASTGVLRLVGNSFPEDSNLFYDPLIKDLSHFLLQLSSLQVELDFNYVNTSSEKHLVRLLNLLLKTYPDPGDLNITWVYAADDESMQEMGEDLASEFDLSITLLAKEASLEE